MAKGIKTGGRVIGSLNHTSKEVRNILKEVIDNELHNIDDLLNELSTKDRLDFIIKLLPYVLSKLAPEPIEQPKEPIKQFEVVVLKGNGQPYTENDTID
jgi:hypothetical protein